MGEKIEFPKNYETYLKKAIDSFDSGNMKEAIIFFEKAYAIKQELRIHSFYVTALYENGEYKKAKIVADKEIDYYESEDNLILFYVTILIKGHFFIQAEKIVKEKLAQTNDSDLKWHSQFERIEKEKEQVRIQNEKKYESLIRNIFSMGNQSFEKQACTLKEAKELPLPQFIKAASSLLSNPYVNSIVKTTTIDYLIDRKVKDEMVLEWFGERRIIKLMEILPIVKTKAVQEIERILKETIENNDPILFEAISQEANLHFMILYPFIDEVIKSPNDWVTLYLKRYNQLHEGSRDEKESLEQKKIKKWMYRLNEQIQTWI
ncbi:tetratricopeptide repeat protein [Carnobacterium sp. TMP28]|uniref:tetratricopeptide repeat protein n=1 Tax=Carnobacterium sp. TMP28 TaxID=3397060 RepID=UPI0039E1E089